MVRKLVCGFLILAFISPCVLAQDVIELEKVKDFDIKYNEKIETLKGSLFVDNTMEAQNQINIQQKADLEDIEMLWKATVENNSIIKFAMKKLSIPPEQQRYHSSVLADELDGTKFLPRNVRSELYKSRLRASDDTLTTLGNENCTRYLEARAPAPNADLSELIVDI